MDMVDLLTSKCKRFSNIYVQQEFGWLIITTFNYVFLMLIITYLLWVER